MKTLTINGRPMTGGNDMDITVNVGQLWASYFKWYLQKFNAVPFREWAVWAVNEERIDRPASWFLTF